MKSKAGSIPSFRQGHVSSSIDVARLRGLSAPHVDGFDFFLDYGLPRAIADIEPAEMDLSTAQNSPGVSKKEGSKLKIWVEGVKIAPPLKSGPVTQHANPSRQHLLQQSPSNSFTTLTPRECRELGLMYSGSMTGEFCYQMMHSGADGIENQGRVVRIKKKFGDMPIMVMSKACNLRGKRPKELIQMKEEVRSLNETTVHTIMEYCEMRWRHISKLAYCLSSCSHNYLSRFRTTSYLLVCQPFNQ